MLPLQIPDMPLWVSCTNVFTVPVCRHCVACWMTFHVRWTRQRPRWTTSWRKWQKSCTCQVVWYGLMWF